MKLKIVKKQTDMKKNILIITILLSSLFVSYGQEKGFYLALSGNYGHNTFNYTLDNKAHSRYPNGWGAGLAAQYFFTKNWGLSLGFEWFSYNGRATYSNDWQRNPKHYATEHMIDELGITVRERDEQGDIVQRCYTNVDYTLRLSIKDWQERQHGYVINIPLMVQYQTKWGRKQMVGMYWAAGLKFQIPVLKQTYSVYEGDLQVLAYYPNHDLLLGEPYNLENHALGTADEETYKERFDGTMKIKGFSVAACGELGLLFSFSRRVDMGIGLYVDYGFLNMKKRDAHPSGNLIMPNVDDNKEIDPHALDEAMIKGQIGDGLLYNGLLQSHAVNKMNLFAFGGKATLRIKLGKLSDRSEEEMSDREFMKALADSAREQQQRQAEEDRAFYKGLLQALADTISKPCPDAGEWNPDSPYSPNNPNNPNYNYPAWYTPDYLNDPVYKNKAGMSSKDEGPNNPNAIERNQNKVKQIVAEMTESIYFDLDKYDLKDKSIEVLDRKIAQMKKYPSMTIALVGHTCDLGNNPHNDELSYNRCISARNYMIRKGIRASRIDIVPMGKHHPDYPNNNETNRERNRRVDFMTVE
jgi:outer membrane protein OmpA-like peptidoglycan-associated protein